MYRANLRRYILSVNSKTLFAAFVLPFDSTGSSSTRVRHRDEPSQLCLHFSFLRLKHLQKNNIKILPGQLLIMLLEHIYSFRYLPPVTFLTRLGELAYYVLFASLSCLSISKHDVTSDIAPFLTSGNAIRRPPASRSHGIGCLWKGYR